MIVLIILFFVCILIAGFIGKFVGGKFGGRLSSKHNFLTGVIGSIGVGGIIGLIYWSYIKSLPPAEMYSRGDGMMNMLAVLVLTGGVIGAILIPILANKYWKRK